MAGSPRTALKVCARCWCRTKRDSHSPTARPRKHHRAVTSIEFAGRWSAVRSLIGNVPPREESLEIYARTLLRRYGVMFRRMLERESLRVPWFELLRIYRQLEARGEIRGGYFVSGVSGEQFALPEAVGLLRSIRRTRAREGKQSALRIDHHQRRGPVESRRHPRPRDRASQPSPPTAFFCVTEFPSPLSRLVN